MTDRLLRGAMRERLVGVIVLVAVAVGVALLYSILVEKRYEAQARILVTPVPDHSAFVGLSVLRQSEQGPSPVETAAALVETRQIADAVATRLGRVSAEDVLEAVDAHPVGEGNVLAIEAAASGAARAAQIANGFSDEFVARRSARFQSEVQGRIRRLREELSAIPAARRDAPRARTLDTQLAVLSPLAGNTDPTLQAISDAVAPADAAWPRPSLIVPLAAAGALLLGLLLVFLAELRAGRGEEATALPVEAPSVTPPADPAHARRVAEGVESRLGRRLEPSAERTERAAADAESEGRSAERERELELRMRKVRELEGRHAERERELTAGVERLERRVAAVTSRETGLAKREAKLAAAERASTAPTTAIASPPASAAQPARAEREGAFNLNELERLVAERGERYPDRLDEWRSYLFLLRGHTGLSGNLASSFDWLIHDVFGELVEEAARDMRQGGEEHSGL
jgi:hypothetical protein